MQCHLTAIQKLVNFHNFRNLINVVINRTSYAFLDWKDSSKESKIPKDWKAQRVENSQRNSQKTQRVKNSQRHLRNYQKTLKEPQRLLENLKDSQKLSKT